MLNGLKITISFAEAKDISIEDTDSSRPSNLNVYKTSQGTIRIINIIAILSWILAIGTIYYISFRYQLPDVIPEHVPPGGTGNMDAHAITASALQETAGLKINNFIAKCERIIRHQAATRVDSPDLRRAHLPGAEGDVLKLSTANSEIPGLSSEAQLRKGTPALFVFIHDSRGCPECCSNPL
jgi:hypothetical protein